MTMLSTLTMIAAAGVASALPVASDDHAGGTCDATSQAECLTKGGCRWFSGPAGCDCELCDKLWSSATNYGAATGRA